VLADLLALGRGEGSTWGTLPEAPLAELPPATSGSGWAGPWLEVDGASGRPRYPLMEEPAAPLR
jgi:hypothetical protein